MSSAAHVAILALAMAVPALARAETLAKCPPPDVSAQIREESGSSLDALMNAVAVLERRYGPAHSRKRISDDEVRLIYRGPKGAVSVSLARDGTGRIATDCIAY